MTNISFDALTDIVEKHARDYEDALIDLENAANTGGGVGGLSISQATVATTKVQIKQSLLEMASGIAKNAADQVKGLGRKISGG